MGTCNCPCCKSSRRDNENQQESRERERKYPEEDEMEAIEQTKPLKGTKSRRGKKHKLQIDYFDKMATEIIKYGIVPYLYVWERIGLSRVNKTFNKLFTMKQATKSYFNVTKFFKPYREKEEFLDENCKGVGSCKFSKLSYGERKLLLFFILCQQYNDFDKVYAVNLWSLKNSKHNNYYEFISNLLFCLTATTNYLKRLQFSDLFRSNKDFAKYFIEPFSYNKFVGRKTYKFYNLSVLNLDFNQGINDSNCSLLFTKCVIPTMCPKLEELHLTHTNIGDASCRRIYNFYYKYMSNTHIHELILNDNYKITSKGVDHINKVLSSYKTSDSTKYPTPTVSLKNNLNKRNWRLYKPYWHKNIVTGYKPPPPPTYNKKGKKGKKGKKKGNRSSGGGGRAF